jgi:hypothetical protein
MQNLASNVKISYGRAAVGNANNTDSNTAILDMSGFDGVLFVAPITDCVQAGVATLTVESNAANSDAGMAAITGAAATATSAANDDLNGKCLVVDVFSPQKRYVQAVVTSATQNIAFGDVIAIQYRGRKAPVSVAASIASQVAVVGA